MLISIEGVKTSFGTHFVARGVKNFNSASRTYAFTISARLAEASICFRHFLRANSARSASPGDRIKSILHSRCRLEEHVLRQLPPCPSSPCRRRARGFLHATRTTTTCRTSGSSASRPLVLIGTSERFQLLLTLGADHVFLPFYCPSLTLIARAASVIYSWLFACAYTTEKQLLSLSLR
jgi:hypothetical protein